MDAPFTIHDSIWPVWSVVTPPAPIVTPAGNIDGSPCRSPTLRSIDGRLDIGNAGILAFDTTSRANVHDQRGATAEHAGGAHAAGV